MPSDRLPRMNRLESLKVQVSDEREVSAIFAAPPKPISCYVMAHGAGAGMTHSFTTAVSDGLVERGIGTLRYQFPFMEKGSRRPDSPAIAHATVRAAVAEAARRCPSLPLTAGGKGVVRLMAKGRSGTCGRLRSHIASATPVISRQMRNAPARTAR